MTFTAKSILFALAILVLGGCGDSRLSTVQSTKSVRVGVLADNPPFSYQLGKSWVGFDIDIAQGIANNLGIEKIDFVPLSLAQRSDQVVAGGVDMVIASMTVTRYRERRVDFSIPYFQDGAALLVKVASPIKSYLDTGGKTIGAIKGSTGSFYMKQVNPDAKVELFADNAELRAALDAGKVDAIVHDYIILAGIVANAADTAAYRIAGERFTIEPYAIAVQQNDSAWRNAINHALIELWEKGEWQNSANTWFGPGSKFASPVTFVMQVYPR